MIDNNETIYISGPMTGLPDFNRPAFHAMEKILNKNFGCKVLNPARITDEHVKKKHSGLLWGARYRCYIRHDIALIFRATGIVLLNGHIDSRGATAELAVAECLRLRILNECDILEYAKKQVKK